MGLQTTLDSLNSPSNLLKLSCIVTVRSNQHLTVVVQSTSVIVSRHLREWVVVVATQPLPFWEVHTKAPLPTQCLSRKIPFCDLTKDHQQVKVQAKFLHKNRCKFSFGKMDVSTSKMPPQTSLFQVFLRLRPPMQQNAVKPSDPWLLVEEPSLPAQEETDFTRTYPTHITLQPPNDSRKRAIERFGFTKVFHKEASQLEVFEEIGAMENLQNVLKSGRDGLIATLGVTGSGKVGTVFEAWTSAYANRAIQSWVLVLIEV